MGRKCQIERALNVYCDAYHPASISLSSPSSGVSTESTRDADGRAPLPAPLERSPANSTRLSLFNGVEEFYADDDLLSADEPHMRLQMADKEPQEADIIRGGGAKGRYPPHAMLVDQGQCRGNNSGMNLKFA